MSWRRWVYRLLLGLLPLVLLAAACQPAALTQQTKIKVAYATRTGPTAVAWIALDKGFYKKYGLDVELVFVEGGTTSVQAVVGGDSPLAIVSSPAVVNAQIEGAEITFVGTIVNYVSYYIMSAKDITKPEQLRGKKWALSKFGDLSHAGTMAALKEFGLTDKDVVVLQVGSTPARFAALGAGSVSATLLGEPGLMLKGKASGFNLLTTVKIMYPGSALVANTAFLKKNPNVVEAFLKASLESVHFYLTNKEESKQLLAKYLMIEDKDELDATYQQWAETFAKDLRLSLEGLQTLLNDTASTQPKAKDVKAESLVDEGILANLAKSGFIDKLYK